MQSTDWKFDVDYAGSAKKLKKRNKSEGLGVSPVLSSTVVDHSAFVVLNFVVDSALHNLLGMFTTLITLSS